MLISVLSIFRIKFVMICISDTQRRIFYVNLLAHEHRYENHQFLIIYTMLIFLSLVIMLLLIDMSFLRVAKVDL